MEYKNIIISINENIGIITLNRPEALNALNEEITSEIGNAVNIFENDENIGAIILTGSQKSFAAGADIKEIKDKTFAEVYLQNFITATWEDISRARKPTIAAVSGFAIGGGCELAMMCDIIIASETAVFSLPETKIGIIPGAGGTQRLTKLVGKAIAMDMILSGRQMDANEALARGLISRLSSKEEYLNDAINLAKQIAKSSRPILMLAKEAINKSYETHLSEGIYVERRLLYSTFATHDRFEGMNAFAQKRKPKFENR